MSTNTQLPFAISLELDSSLANKTGSWRTKRPVYVDRIPPCNRACPAGENIQAWLYLAEEARYEEAWQALVEDNPFPAIHGRVCYHPCESGCNRTKLDEPVSIHAVERFLGDQAIKHGWLPKMKPATGKRVIVIGSGPTGLSCAYHCARLGHHVTIYDAGEKPGGMMRYGIPKYRLPREVLDAELDLLVRMGIRFVQSARIDDLAKLMETDRADAVFLACGAGLSKKIDIPNWHARHVIDAVKMLRDIESDSPPMLGRRVAVYGGGNTALDAARSALRLGAEEVVLVYRRDRKRMPAHSSEVIDAEEEGVKMKWLSTIADLQADPGRDTIRIEKMKLNAKGQPEPTGEYEELGADTVILAIGQEAETGFLRNMPGLQFDKDGSLLVDQQMMSGVAGVFAGGDMTPATRTVTNGVGNGKKAARCIDAFLAGGVYEKPYTLGSARGDDGVFDPKVKEIASFDRLNPWYYTDAPKHIQERLAGLRRLDGFAEIVSGLDETDAMHESRRCLSCGNCFECDNCYGVCPDNAVIKLGPGNRFEFNYEYCKGCGLCSVECPCGAIKMVEEKI